jgi:hypothetical protein
MTARRFIRTVSLLSAFRFLSVEPASADFTYKSRGDFSSELQAESPSINAAAPFLCKQPDSTRRVLSHCFCFSGAAILIIGISQFIADYNNNRFPPEIIAWPLREVWRLLISLIAYS